MEKINWHQPYKHESAIHKEEHTEMGNIKWQQRLQT